MASIYLPPVQGKACCMIASPRLARELFQDVLTRNDGVNATQTKFKDVHYMLTMCYTVLVSLDPKINNDVG